MKHPEYLSAKTERTQRNLSMNPLFPLTTMVITTFALSLTSCNEGPEYSRPPVSNPATYRNANGETSKPDSETVKEYLGDLFWWNFLQDDVLKDLIAKAIVQNYDVKLATEKILAAQAQLGIIRASQFPTANATGGYQTTNVTEVGPTPSVPGQPNNTYFFNVGFQANYEADFWGRLRNATLSQSANLLATEKAKNVTLMTLVSELATAYLQLHELDLELEISRQTLKSRLQSPELVKARLEEDVANQMNLDQAQSLVYSAEKAITSIEQKIAIQENTICYLLGENSHDITRGKPLAEQFTGTPVPPGLPSFLLLNRPDIREAELFIIAANFELRALRAAYFPQIILSADSGILSKELANLFSAKSYTWSFISGIAQPIFNGGQIKSKVALSESQKQQAIINYQSTILKAFKEVSNSLIAYQKSVVYLKQQENYIKTLADQSYIANLRYEGGVSSYLEVLDTERYYFDAQLSLAKAQLNVYANIVKLYRSLGEEWKQKPETLLSQASPKNLRKYKKVPILGDDN